MNRFSFWLGLVAVIHLGFAQEETPAPSISDRKTEQLMAAGQLWGYIKYHHPTLAFREIDWDAAFVATGPALLEAETDEDYHRAVEGLLAKLNDPVTRLISTRKPEAESSVMEPVWDRSTDRMIIRFGNASPERGELVREILGNRDVLAAASSLIIDLQGCRSIYEADLVMAQSGLTRLLVTENISAPAQRWRLHRGYVPQRGSGSGGYQAGIYTANGSHFVAQPGARKIPCVFLVRNFIPAVALALQATGQAAVVGVGEFDESSYVETTSRALPGNLQAQVRTSEVIHPDGQTGVQVNAAVNEDVAALVAAAQWLDGQLASAVARPTVPAVGQTTIDLFFREPALPPPSLRLLAVFRAWAVIEYFFPYKSLIGAEWTELVRAALPGIVGASTARDYHLAVVRLLTQLNDSHVFITSAPHAEFLGTASVPLRLQMVEGSPVILTAGPMDGITGRTPEPGDAIVAIDGKPWRARYDELAPYLAASTPQARDWVTLLFLLAGPPESNITLTLRDPLGTAREVILVRKIGTAAAQVPSRTGEVVKLLGPDVGYADLERLNREEVDGLFERFAETKAIIFDVRGYPRGTAWPIASRLVERAGVAAARFEPPMVSGMRGEGDAPREFNFTFIQNVPAPRDPRYTGKIVMLIDEHAVSQSEHTGLFLRAAGNAVFVGSPTNGANGDVTNFILPGGISVNFTGQAVSWPDGRQLQRIGLQPDVPIRPTQAGIAAGRDEVLEAALHYLDTQFAR